MPGVIPSSFKATTAGRFDSSFRSRQPVLRREPSEADEAVQDAAVDEPQGQLLRDQSTGGCLTNFMVSTVADRAQTINRTGNKSVLKCKLYSEIAVVCEQFVAVGYHDRWYDFRKNCCGGLMDKSMKAALLSALVFPGTGHLYLKKYLSGVALASIAVGALYFLTSTAIEKAVGIAEKIKLGEVTPDIETIIGLVSNQSTGVDSKLINIASIILFFSWLISIVDSYMAGRAKK